MQAAQPFSWTELATNMSSKRQQLSDEDFRWSAIYRLQQLNNIDKHRRLPALGVGWPEMFYWGSDEGDDTRFRLGASRPPTTRSCPTWSGRTRPTSNYRLSSRWCSPMTRGTSRAKTTTISLRTAKSCWRPHPAGRDDPGGCSEYAAPGPPLGRRANLFRACVVASVSAWRAVTTRAPASRRVSRPDRLAGLVQGLC